MPSPAQCRLSHPPRTRDKLKHFRPTWQAVHARLRAGCSCGMAHLGAFNNSAGAVLHRGFALSKPVLYAAVKPASHCCCGVIIIIIPFVYTETARALPTHLFLFFALADIVLASSYIWLKVEKSAQLHGFRAPQGESRPHKTQRMGAQPCSDLQVRTLRARFRQGPWLKLSNGKRNMLGNAWTHAACASTCHQRKLSRDNGTQQSYGGPDTCAAPSRRALL